MVDDGSVDSTREIAARHGTAVVTNDDRPGKGGALRTGLAATTSDLVVFLDADVTNFHAGFITALVAPLTATASVHLVKPRYRRPLHDQPSGGGRVTELLARPLLARFHPELAHLRQPLAGETGVRRAALADIELSDGYGIEIALLIDVCRRYGSAAITEVDLGERAHRNRPLHELRGHADAVLGAVMSRQPVLEEVAIC